MDIPLYRLSDFKRDVCTYIHRVSQTYTAKLQRLNLYIKGRKKCYTKFDAKHALLENNLYNKYNIINKYNDYI